MEEKKFCKGLIRRLVLLRIRKPWVGAVVRLWLFRKSIVSQHKNTVLLCFSLKRTVFYGMEMPRKPAPYYSCCLWCAALYLYCADSLNSLKTKCCCFCMSQWQGGRLCGNACKKWFWFGVKVLQYLFAYRLWGSVEKRNLGSSVLRVRTFQTENQG